MEDGVDGDVSVDQSKKPKLMKLRRYALKEALNHGDMEVGAVDEVVVGDGENE